MNPYLYLMKKQEWDLLKSALSTSYGEKIIGQLGAYEELRDTECYGTINQGKAIQLITDYIIWSFGCPLLNVQKNAHIPNHPLMQFINEHRDVIQIVPEVITHYVKLQGWNLDTSKLPDEVKQYVPAYVEREVNIE